MMVLSMMKVYTYNERVTGCPNVNNAFRKCPHDKKISEYNHELTERVSCEYTWRP